MQIIVWGVFVFLAAIWTGGVALMVALLQGAVRLLEQGEGADFAGVVDTPVPEWLAPWIDLLGWQEWLQGVVALLESFRAVLPAFGQLMDWVVPVAWGVWGVGLFGLSVLTLIASRLVTRFRP